MTNKPIIAIFDFDGTITSKDTMLDFVRWHFGITKLLVGLVITLPYIILHKLKIISNQTSKEKFLSHFFKEMPYEKFAKIAREYSLTKIDKIVKKEALEKIRQHQKQNHQLIIITASLKEWVEPWAFNNGFDEVITSKIAVIDGKISGKLVGGNCYGAEKLKAFEEKFGEIGKNYSFVYGDSDGDKEVLAKADEKFYQKY